MKSPAVPLVWWHQRTAGPLVADPAPLVADPAPLVADPEPAVEDPQRQRFTQRASALASALPRALAWPLCGRSLARWPLYNLPFLCAQRSLLKEGLMELAVLWGAQPAGVEPHLHSSKPAVRLCLMKVECSPRYVLRPRRTKAVSSTK
jgi:hypothetical protein